MRRKQRNAQQRPTSLFQTVFTWCIALALSLIVLELTSALHGIDTSKILFLSAWAVNNQGDAANTAHQVLYQQQQSLLPKLPKARVNVREWTAQLSEELAAVSNRTSCVWRIERIFEKQADKFYTLEAAKLRDNIVQQITQLLSQHKSAVVAIASEAERLAAAHVFVKNLRLNYTDVHRLRNELDAINLPQLTFTPGDVPNEATAQQQQQQLAANSVVGTSSQAPGGPGAGGQPVAQFTSIGGGTPVPGPPEWQTPVRTVIMRINRNFGEVPVNTSMSAVHLPLPIYPGQPDIMNGIAWTERLDLVFKHNLAAYAHVHHQYYGDHLGFMRTFPAHKWRIPRLEPDLFDARTRPWYSMGASSPKDVVILVDTSGSMTGLRREIAKGVVFEILDTLTHNDNFAVLRFSEQVTPVGLPKCSNLRTPHMGPQLDEMCSRQAPPLSARERTECINWRKQQEARTAYVRDQQRYTAAKQRQSSSQHRKQQQSQRLNPSVAEFSASRDEVSGVSGGSSSMRGEIDAIDEDNLQQLGARAYNGSYMNDDAYKFSIANITQEISDAYLLPANARNIRYLKSNFSMPTAGIANFTHALMAAFELLNAYNRTGDMGSQCNQAIMLITDGAIRSHEDVFNRYNYPRAPVRLFTYMIGREVGDIRPTKAMACTNRGYYTHVINLGEVREQVQKYLPVMARPMVLAHQHPNVWTNAYGDETHQVLTDWVLEVKRRERARIMLAEERERLYEANSSNMINIEPVNIAEYDEIPSVDEMLRKRPICEEPFDLAPPDTTSAAANDADAQSLREEVDPLGYNELACHWSSRRADLLTSVVRPVFDVRNTSLVFERILHKNIWTEKETHVRNAQLLGVAAVDLRIADIVRLVPSHMLGPNAYAILVGQNGFVLHHPDLRALLEDPFDKQSKILKPYFNAVDLTQLEQLYHKNDSDPARRRADDARLLAMREAILSRKQQTLSLYVKRAVDCRKRLHIRKQEFHYAPIKDTPFALVLAFPANYGANRLVARTQLDQHSPAHLAPSAHELWTVHPEYRYCDEQQASPPVGSPPSSSHRQRSASQEPTNGNEPEHSNSVATILRVLNSVQDGSSGSVVYDDLATVDAHQVLEKHPNRIVCDRDLFQSLLFDAAATSEQPAYCSANSRNGQDARLCGSHFARPNYASGYDSDDSVADDNSMCANSPDEMR